MWIVSLWEELIRDANEQGNLDERCTDALIWELMLQAGPVGTSLPGFAPKLLTANYLDRPYLNSQCASSKGPYFHGTSRVRVL